MNLIKSLLREHSKAQCTRIVSYIGNRPARFEELVKVFLGGPYRVTQRAAWPLSYCVALFPRLVEPHLNRILNFAGKAGVHDAAVRNTIRFLQHMEVPLRHQGKVANLCFRMLQDRKQPVAIRAFSMTVLGNLCRHQPGLKNELIAIVQDELPVGSAAIRVRGKKVLKQLSVAPSP